VEIETRYKRARAMEFEFDASRFATLEGLAGSETWQRTKFLPALKIK
jgi:hypothetical protein